MGREMVLVVMVMITWGLRYWGQKRVKAEFYFLFFDDIKIHLPNLPLLGRRHTHRLRDQIIIRHDARPGLQRRHRCPQYLHHVHIRPVVEDVAEQIHLCLAHRLGREEIMLHEGNPVGDVRGYGRFGAADHVGEILHDEVEMGVGLREGDADVASGAADVDDGAFAIVGGGADGRPGVAFRQEAGREADAVGEGGHGAREAFRHVRVRGVVLPYGLVGPLGQVPAGSVGFVALEFLARFHGPRERLPHFVEHVAEPGLGVWVVGELAGGGRVRDVAFAGFVEDAVVGYGEADDAAEVGDRHAAFPAKVGEGDIAVDGDVGGDVVFVDCL